MKFKNKITNEIVEANTYVKVFAFTHNSNWEKVTEPKEPTKAEIQAKLDELGIEYDKKANKETLLALFSENNEEE